MVLAICAKILSSLIYVIHNKLIKYLNYNVIEIAVAEYFYIALFFLLFQSIELKNIKISICTGFLSSIAIIFCYYGYQQLPLYISGTCIMIHSLIVLIASLVISHERISRTQIIAYLIALISVYTIDFSFSFLIILFAQIIFAIITIIQKFYINKSFTIQMISIFFFLYLYYIFFTDQYCTFQLIFNYRIVFCALLAFTAQYLIQYSYSKTNLIILTIFGKVKPMLMLISDGNIFNLTIMISLISIILIIIDMHAYQKGLQAEYKAIQFLKQNHCIILAHRKKTIYGEIDILMKENNVLVAVEVKMRNSYMKALHSISEKQYLRISNSLLMMANEYNHTDDLRIDRILLVQNELSWFKNIIL